MVESASRRAFRYVKEQILDGSLAGGALLSEGEIAESLELSRTPVRAAFVQLESEGLLRLYPKRGALVVPVTAQEAEAVIEARWVIERYAIERADTALGAELTALAGGAAGEDFIAADRAFHRTLVAGTGNGILLSLYDSLRDRQRRMSRASARKVQITAEHHELAAAIASGATEQALRILRRHLDGALGALRRG